ncbi:MAG: laccase domain-containing protein [Dialister sp.]|nr:laccase domain-containing protein [Dialister sp.]
MEDCHICTYGENDLFYSYRKAGGITGRHMAVMMLK